MKKILVVGAGFSGTVIARMLAETGKYDITVIDQRDHIGGNAYDYFNEHGIRVHKYGPHIFHTNNQRVVEFLSRFTEWVPYEHRVRALLMDGRYVPLPVNRETLKHIPAESIVDVFYRPYSEKMWGMKLEDIDPGILSRVKARDDDVDLYFPNDSFQFMPKEGYTPIFASVLDHKNIRLSLSTKFESAYEKEYSFTFNSMPIDEYFGFDLGELPYRSIKFHTLTLPAPRLLPTATVNFTHSGPFTRMTEWKHFPNHGDNPACTTLTYEEPCDYKDNSMERYYPVKDVSGVNRALYEQYQARAHAKIKFVGRCGLYAYLDMHQAISSAMNIARQFVTDDAV